MIGLEDIRDAAGRIASRVKRTPVLTSRALNERTEADVLLKAENFQHAGSFKLRGAINAIAQLARPELQCGVATSSSGNHGRTVALAARWFGAHATIVMPGDAPQSKVTAVEAYGAEVLTVNRYDANLVEAGVHLARERGLTFVHPCEDLRVIEGQGTVALEFLEVDRNVDIIVAPVGGGGLITGCAVVAKALNPHIRVVGVEPYAGSDTKQSLDLGRCVTIAVPRTIADGLQPQSPGKIAFEHMRRLVDEVVLVHDTEILHAMEFAFDRLTIVLKPSGAVSIAALLTGKIHGITGKRIGAVLSGGNIAAARFAALMLGTGGTPPPRVRRSLPPWMHERGPFM